LFRSINTLAGVSKEAQVEEVELDLSEEDETEDHTAKVEEPTETLKMNEDSKEEKLSPP